jgi:hypothetical protein
MELLLRIRTGRLYAGMTEPEVFFGMILPFILFNSTIPYFSNVLSVREKLDFFLFVISSSSVIE